ncbi:leucine-rich repeat domain-containing protein, partial [Treponema primitia]|uniref:leucine-rich repeat protein n=1 Tax=Treponema primitia TaxID=88058 RepID=UPI00397F7096
ANITSGNMGENIRNDIAWSKQWTARLEEAEKVYADNVKGPTPYYLVYDFNIQQGAVDYKNETVTISGVTVDLVPVAAWFNASASVVNVVNVVRQGLLATGRAETWGLNWPRNSVGRNYPFGGQSESFTVVVELVNQDGTTIGSERVTVEGGWNLRWKDNDKALWGLIPRIQGSRSLSFQRVNANLITPQLTIRIASIDGVNAETASKTKAINILREAEYAQLPEVRAGTDSRSVARLMPDIEISPSGEITKYKGAGGNVVIPASIFGIPVTAIGAEAFTKRIYTGPNNFQYQSVELTSITLPNGLTRIGDSAFFATHLAGIAIPNSVTEIAKHALGGSVLSITIPANVTLTDEIIFYSKFVSFYNKNGKKAGTYTRPKSKYIISTRWTYTP